MEQKKAKIFSSLRSVFSVRLCNNSFSFSGNPSNSQQNSIAGYTLVELLVVIGLVAILAIGTTLIMNPGLQLKKARDADRKSDLKQIQVALEIFRADQGAYPTGSNIAGNCPTTTPTSLVELDSDGNCPSSPTKIFIQSVPKDPKTNVNYYYTSTGTTYTIYSCLENTGDTEKLASTPDSSITGPLSCPSGTTAYYSVSNQ